jgi:hypothetical protein
MNRAESELRRINSTNSKRGRFKLAETDAKLLKRPPVRSVADGYARNGEMTAQCIPKAQRQYVQGGHFTSKTLYKGKIVSIQYISNRVNIPTDIREAQREPGHSSGWKHREAKDGSI